MSEGFPYGDILILALIAIFILLRLRSVLGNKTGNENNYFNKMLTPASDKAEQHGEPIVQVDDKSSKPKPKEETDPYLAALGNSEIGETINQIKLKDLQFSATGFLVGARAAFEMVFDAFVKGDRQTLKMLMSDTIFQHFAKELDRRDAQQNKLETTLISVTAKDITHAVLEKNTARLTVSFASEQVQLMRGPKQEIVEGDPSELHHVEDHWSFERDVTSKNPNWKIIET